MTGARGQAERPPETAWNGAGEGNTRRGNGVALPSPEGVVAVVAILFAAAGGIVYLPVDASAPLTATLFDGFMYVGLPLGVLAGAVGLRRSDLPRREQWYVVSGYAAGIAFVEVLLLWSELAYLADGGTLLALRSEFVFYGNVGGVLGFVAGTNRARAANDRRLRRELERQNETLEEFASAVSHDLRSPLQVASGRVVLARRECDCDEHLAEVEHALDRMETLIEESLVLARQGERIVDAQPLRLAPLVDSCWRAVEATDAELVVDVPSEATIRADEVRVAQVLENLLGNAVQHGGDGVAVRVGTLPDGFYVADDGPGIPPEDRTEVFESGYTTAEAGTGYGLRIVRAIVDAHGWDIALGESEAGGARFEITGVEMGGVAADDVVGVERTDGEEETDGVAETDEEGAVEAAPVEDRHRSSR